MRISEWSSDVCSSDLPAARDGPSRRHPVRRSYLGAEAQHDPAQAAEAEAPRRSRLSRAPSMSLRLVFMGTPDFAVPVLEAFLGAGDTVAAVYSQPPRPAGRSEEHTSELQSLMRISYAVFCLKKKKKQYISASVMRAPKDPS